MLYRAKGYIENAASDLHTLNELPSAWDTDSSRRLRVVVEFVKDTVKILDEKGVPDHVRIRVREKHGHPRETFYDHIASMIFEVIFHASAVRAPQWGCWTIQHNLVWGELFNFNHLDCPAGKVVKFKVRRLLYDEIADMKGFPNFKGAKLLGFCLNVMGLTARQGDYDKDSRALQKVVLAWTKRNFVWLHRYNPRVAEACLVDGMTFDVENWQLVRTSPAEGLRREPSYIYLELDRPQLKPSRTRLLALARRRSPSDSGGCPNNNDAQCVMGLQRQFAERTCSSEQNSCMTCSQIRATPRRRPAPRFLLRPPSLNLLQCPGRFGRRARG